MINRICRNCGKSYVKTKNISTTHFCSKNCLKLDTHKKNSLFYLKNRTSKKVFKPHKMVEHYSCAIEKFDEQWDLSTTEFYNGTGCHIWNGTIAGPENSKYPHFYYDKATYRAQRWIWEYHNGEIPKDKQINHLCRSKSCVRLSHLYLGTQKDNMRDKFKDGTAYGMGKYDDDTKQQMLKDYQAGVHPREIERQYKLPHKSVTMLLIAFCKRTGQKWIPGKRGRRYA